MTLFQILTRQLAAGKKKVTHKLLKRLHRETSGRRRSKPAKMHAGNRHGFARTIVTKLVATWMLAICLMSGQTAAAAQSSENNIATSGYSAAALFNQANVFAREGKTGLAVLNYERAQLLAPHDADIGANLHLILANAGLPDAPENWFTRSLTYVPSNTLAWLGSFGLVLAGLSILLVRLKPQRRLVFALLTLVGALLVISSIGSAIMMWPRLNEAVVIAHEAPARTSPVSVVETAFKLREGETVMVRAERQAFALVQTTAGRSGWVPRVDLAPVVPLSGQLARSKNQT
jgi:hypothetical protein